MASMAGRQRDEGGFPLHRGSPSLAVLSSAGAAKEAEPVGAGEFNAKARGREDEKTFFHLGVFALASSRQAQSCRFARFYDSRHGPMAFFAHFLRFCGKSVEVLIQEQFTHKTGFLPAQPGQTQSNPVKPLFFTLTRNGSHPLVSVDRTGTALPLGAALEEGIASVTEGRKVGRAVLLVRRSLGEGACPPRRARSAPPAIQAPTSFQEP